MATISTFAGGTYNPTYVSSGVSNGILVETWDRFTVERDNSNTSGTITWTDISGSNPWKFNFTQSSSQPSYLHGNGHIEDITSKDGWYLHSWDLDNSYKGYTIISHVSTGSGPAPLSVAEPEGSIARTSLTNVRVVIDKNSPSSNATVSYDLQVNGVSHGPGITHTQSSTNDFVTNLTFVTGTWRLWYQESGSGDQLLAERDYFNNKRRVHCNFW